MQRASLPAGKRLQDLPIRFVNVFSPNDENHFLELIAYREKFARRFECNVCGFLNRIAVRATTDRGKRDRFDSILQRNLQ